MKKHAYSCLLGPETTKPINNLRELQDGTIVYEDSIDPTMLEDNSVLSPLAYLGE